MSIITSVILKMDKGGHWIYGAEQTEVESDSTWAVNPFSFIHGYIAWGDGDVLGDQSVLCRREALQRQHHHKAEQQLAEALSITSKV